MARRRDRGVAFHSKLLASCAGSVMLLAWLEGRSDLPAGLRAALDRQRRQIETVIALPAVHHRVQLTVLGGAETNLNNAPAVSELTLTLPNGQGKQTLPLAPSSLLRS